MAEFLMLRELTDGMMGDLKERERDVIILRYGLVDGDHRTLEEAGRKFYCSRERVRQIEHKVLGKIHDRKN